MNILIIIRYSLLFSVLIYHPAHETRFVSCRCVPDHCQGKGWAVAILHIIFILSFWSDDPMAISVHATLRAGHLLCLDSVNKSLNIAATRHLSNSQSWFVRLTSVCIHSFFWDDNIACITNGCLQLNYWLHFSLSSRNSSLIIQLGGLVLCLSIYRWHNDQISE